MYTLVFVEFYVFIKSLYQERKKLDNPVYHSLCETHQDKALEYKGVKFYDPAYCSFGGVIDPLVKAKDLANYAQLVSDFFIVGTAPVFDTSLILVEELVCLQMVLDSPIDLIPKEEIVPLESKAQKQALYELVNYVQPGYFKQETSALGRYIGIYQDQQLVAVSGERMKMKGFTEISAIVTHPDYTGRGYAKQLIKHCTQNIFEEGKTPYLHVVESNVAAINLYENLGFFTRRKISFWKLAKI